MTPLRVMPGFVQLVVSATVLLAVGLHGSLGVGLHALLLPQSGGSNACSCCCCSAPDACAGERVEAEHNCIICHLLTYGRDGKLPSGPPAIKQPVFLHRVPAQCTTVALPVRLGMSARGPPPRLA